MSVKGLKVRPLKKRTGRLRSFRCSSYFSFSICLLSVKAIIACALTVLDQDIAHFNCKHSSFDDPESIYSCGERITLQNADVYSLELISGISDRIALSIIARRTQIHEIAAFLRPSERHRAFEVADGVGRETARKLATFVEP